MKNLLKKIIYIMDNSEIISAIRRGIIMVIPVLMLGSFALILKSMPFDGYQRFISHIFSGAFLQMLNFIYDATFGLISVYMAFSISTYFIMALGAKSNYAFVGALTTVVSFFILCGVNVNVNDFNYIHFGTEGIFTAIFCGIIVSKLYVAIINNIKIPFRLYADGIDLEFNDAIIAMIPAAALVIFAAIINYLVCIVFDVDCFQEFYVTVVGLIFKGKEATFLNGFKFVVTSCVMWFLGIYGDDVLEDVSGKIFSSGTAKNIELIAEGKQPTEILSKTFFHHFVLVGGCGTAICLLVAVAIFSKRKINRNLSKIATVPMLFNVDEIMVFGYPIIYNPYLLAPFLVTPVVAYCISYLAMKFGFVPMIIRDVEWTTPIILSGYKATGSMCGAILQIVIVVVGVIIYMPFVKMYDKSKMRSEAARMNELTNILKKAENDNEEINILEVPGVPGALAKCLAADIKNALEDRDIRLFYQLQYDNDFKCIGAETLLRYNHPIHGYIYPPLIIKIAEEAGILSKLERYLFEEAAYDYQFITGLTDKSYKISVNVTISTILEPSFIEFLENLKKEFNIKDNEMCIEITEQMAIKSDSEFEKALNQVKNLGFMIAIDDFSMGSTSIKYLQKNQFDIVKLDGSIVKEMMTNERSREIISSIVYLAKSLNFKVLAEYVETEKQMQALKEIGCDYYQGYHFSKAVTSQEFFNIIQK